MFSLAGMAPMRAGKLCVRACLISSVTLLECLLLADLRSLGSSSLMADDSAPRVDWTLPGDVPTEQLKSSPVPSEGKLAADSSEQGSTEVHSDEEFPVGAFSPLETVSDASSQDVSGRAKLTDFPADESLEGVILVAASVSRTVVTRPNYKEELAELATIDQPVTSSNSNYLSDLNSLLRGNSDWLFKSPVEEEPVAKIAAKPAAQGANQVDTSYIDELSSLASQTDNGEIHRRTMYRQTVAAQDAVSAEKIPLGSSSPEAPYTSISPSPRCNASGELSLASHFSPVSSIKLNGLSTSPPRRHEESANLKRPDDNQACGYMDDLPQSFYLMATAYRNGHPSRNTHCFQHNPLYFEDPNLERCGRSKGCVTPACSAFHFLSTIAMSPFLVVHQCPNTCVTALPDCPTCHSFGPEAYMGGCLPLQK